MVSTTLKPAALPILGRTNAMTTPPPIADLIARLTEAQAPDRELDCHIWQFVEGGSNTFVDRDNLHNNAWRIRVLGCGSISSSWRDAPHYTSTTDAALTRIPTERHWRELVVAALDLMQQLHPEGPWTLDMFARCICIAALKAWMEAG